MPGAWPRARQEGVKSCPGDVDGMRTCPGPSRTNIRPDVQDQGSGGTRQVEQAEVVVAWFPEATTCAAGNEVSFATGTSEEHEAMGLTAAGSWVLRRWRDGVAGETLSPLTAAKAREWLLRCEHFEAVAEHFPSALRAEHPLRLVRLYEPRIPEDGHRLLVDRLWPRGIARSDGRLDSWLPEAGPSAALRAWYGHRPEAFLEFSRRYQEELSSAEWAKPLATIAELRHAGTLTLVTAARDLEHSAARVLHLWLRKAESLT